MSLEKILLIRHAQSLEDVNPSMHNLSDDRMVGLTELGIVQAHGLVKKLRCDPVTQKRADAYVSPSYRAQATWRIVRDAFPRLLHSVTVKCIRNLNWGDITSENKAVIEAERYTAGVLNYAFPGGDYTPDYSDAIQRFVETVLDGSESEDYPECVVVLTHGFALRLLARAILLIGDSEFRYLANPKNCFCAEVLVENGSFGGRRFVLMTPLPVVKL